MQELTTPGNAPLALSMPPEQRAAVMAAFKQNCAQGTITEFDLPRVTIASNGLWSVPGLEGPQTAPFLEGVVVEASNPRAYWKDKDGSGAPDCSSVDGVTGKGEPGGDCATCPLAQFDSAENGSQACKQMKQLFMLRGKSMLPEVVSLPPTSLKAIRQFFLKLATQGVLYHHCLLRLELEKAKNPQGKEYGKAVVKFIRELTPEEIGFAEESRRFVLGFGRPAPQDAIEAK